MNTSFYGFYLETNLKLPSWCKHFLQETNCTTPPTNWLIHLLLCRTPPPYLLHLPTSYVQPLISCHHTLPLLPLFSSTFSGSDLILHPTNNNPSFPHSTINLLGHIPFFINCFGTIYLIFEGFHCFEEIASFQMKKKARTLLNPTPYSHLDWFLFCIKFTRQSYSFWVGGICLLYELGLVGPFPSLQTRSAPHSVKFPFSSVLNPKEYTELAGYGGGVVASSVVKKGGCFFCGGGYKYYTVASVVALAVAERGGVFLWRQKQ